MPQVAAPLRLLLPLSQTLAPAPLLHLSSRLFASFGRATSLRALAYRGQPGRRHHHSRRGSSTLRKAPKEEMDGCGDKEAAFNRKRAEGRDGSKRGTMELKTRRLNPVNTTCYVQILGTGMDTQDTSPSILLFFDKQRFIFNAGEGLQRFCTEHKIKLSKIDHIFLTRVCSETAGGLPGLVLTLAGIGDEGMSVNIWGPSDLDFLAGAMRSFIPNRAMLHTHSFGVERNESSSQSKDSIVILDDEVVRISAMFVKPRYHNGAGSFKDTDLKPGDTAIVYVCELPEIKGKFDPAKAAALGLKPGPKYRELQLGNSVQSDQFDEMVHPSDVLGPSIPGPTVLLVDCPTQYHMPELFSLQHLSCFYEDSSDQTESGKKVNCIIHLGPSSVTKAVDYQNWMKKFGTTQHIMAGHEIKNMEIPILKGSARISSRLNFVCPQLFPASGFWPVEPANVVTEKNKSTLLEACESVSAQNLLKFHLRPYAQLGLDRASIPSLFTYKDIVEELLSEIPEVREVPEQVHKFWQNNVDNKNTLPPVGNLMLMVEEPWISQNSGKLDDGIPSQEIVWRKHPKDNQQIPCCVENATREDMEITFLGTGSSQPSKYRNVSSIYINLFSKGGILLDCGEGTLGQLKRRFGVNGADEAIKSLRCIWISHIHADHHTGLARVLALRSKLLKGMPHKSLLVIGPRPLERFLNAYSTLEDLDMHFLDCRHTLKPSVEAFLNENVTESAMPQLESTMFAPGSRMENYNRKPASPRDTTALTNFKEVLQELGLEILYSVPVVHCPQAFGVVLRAMAKVNSAGKVIPGWKVVYSGDTRPCPALIDASSDATVLIHEATFEDSMKDEAIARNHSTTKEAIEVGTSAGAYRIILTHFSQRYPKIPVIDEVDMEKTCIAFDLMSVNLADLPVLPKVLPHLKVLFKDELVVDESDEALRFIKYAVGKSGTDFKREMQRHSAAMRQLVHYKGHPDPLRGDALNKAVRETANESIAAVFSTEDPKSAVATESIGKRIQGFGNTNYEPSRDDKKSFLSELSVVVGIGSASIKQGLSNFAAAHAMTTNDNGGTYKSPNLRKSLTTESDRYGRYDPSEIQSESRASSGASKNVASSSWGPIPSSSAPTDDTSSRQQGVKSREERLLETIVTASGVRLQPTRDALQVFLTEATKLDAVALSRALESKLNSPLWQVRMKAICVLEAIVRKQDTDPYSIITSYFIENSTSVVKCCELPQVSLREKASKVLSLLVGEQPTGTTNLSATKTAISPPVQMPDLIDTGDQDDQGTQSSGLESNGQITENSAHVSSVDDLLGGEHIANISMTSDANGSNPFADVSFHEAETKETNDLFSGMTVEEKSSAAMHDNSPSNKNELPDIFGSNPDPFIQESVMDQGTVHDLMAGLNLNGTGQAQPAVKAEPNSNLSGSQFFDMNNQTSNVANVAALNGIPGQNSFYQQAPLQYSLPQHMLLNQSFPGQQLNYGAMGILLAQQQQQLLQNFGNFNTGLGHSSFNSVNSGNVSVLPDIFNSSNQPQNHVAVMSNPKKDDTKAFDFVSDHLAAARGSRK
ncbi:tRNase Z TRZ3, mitochondrial-like [Phragmites australis]|uniref:tRNase Z TRZ3, mitochondrial-like n=1 Tax=Phragmites australis TaxID=29695 RepID=UPI002D792132|nr:tRNase Z TRZ3, mitochondrial-like [Phragmites australis]